MPAPLHLILQPSFSYQEVADWTVPFAEVLGGQEAAGEHFVLSDWYVELLERAGCKRSEAVMVGDQVDTDIAGAVRAGVDAILVTSGVDKVAEGYTLLAKLPDVDALVPLL